MSRVESASVSVAQSDVGDATIRVTIVYDRVLWRRAMTGWWQSVVPPSPFVQRAIFWAIVWLIIGGLTLGLSVAGIGPEFVFAGLIGAAFLIGVFGYLQRTRMSRFWDVIGAHWDKAGETEAAFGPDGLILEDGVSQRNLSWLAVDAIASKPGLTVIRSGISMTVVPDAALPDGMSGQAFRKQLATWKSL